MSPVSAHADRLYQHRLLTSRSEHLKHRSPSALHHLRSRYEAACRPIQPPSQPSLPASTHSAMPFRDYCRLWSERRLECRSHTTVEAEYHLMERYAFPFIQDLPISSLQAHLIRQVLRNARNAAGSTTERRLLTAFRSLVKYAVGDGLLSRHLINTIYDRRIFR